MRKTWKSLALALSLALTFTAFTGCGQSADEPASSTNSASVASAVSDSAESLPAAEQLEKVEVVMYLMGDPPPENMLDQFYEKLDEMTLRDFNCTVRFKFSTWTDYGTKYNLMLTTDDSVDLAYSAGWMDYSSYAAKDAFTPLDELLPQYAPDIWNLIAADKWDALRVGGKIYAIPANNDGFSQHGAAYREDLRKKYNLPEITDVDTFGQYLITVKKNEPGMQIPLYEVPFGELFVPSTNRYEYFDNQGKIGNTIALVYDFNDPSRSVIQYETPEYAAFAKKMKEWADQDLWSKSILSSKDGPEAKMRANQGAAWLECQLDKTSGLGYTLMTEQPDWEIGFFPYEIMNGQIFYSRVDQNLMTVPGGAHNGERALMVLNKFMTDREYYDLTQYGIQGVTYNISEDGRLDYSGIDTASNYLSLAAWSWGNDDFTRKNQVEWEKRYEIIDTVLEPKAGYDPFDGLVIDLTAVQAEQAALTQVYAQYARPIEAGFSTDVDVDIAILKEKMDAAGMQRFKAEIDRQIAEFQAAKK